MAYAMAAVGAIISTPYLYAQEVLANGRGQLVPFSDSNALAAATIRYLSDPQFHADTRQRAIDTLNPCSGQKLENSISKFSRSPCPASGNAPLR